MAKISKIKNRRIEAECRFVKFVI